MTGKTLMITDKTAEQILREAADEVERRGLYQGWFCPEEFDENAGGGPDDVLASDLRDCPVCMWGALNYVNFGDPRDDSWANGDLGAEVERLLRDALCLPVAETGYTSNWNDADGRTKEQVVAALRKAADLAN